MPDGHDADALRREILARFDLSLGTGLGKLAGRVFRIGHLGWFNDLMLCGTLCGVEMGLKLAARSLPRGGRAGGDGLAGAIGHDRTGPGGVDCRVPRPGAWRARRTRSQRLWRIP